MGERNKKRAKRVLAVLLVCMLFTLIAQTVFTLSFNRRVYTVNGAGETDAPGFRFRDREDSTSKWLKRDFPWNGRLVNLQGQTVDGTFSNPSGNLVSSWTMTLRVGQDCFINNAWCGTVEIHQHVAEGNEKAQTLDLRNYDIRDVTLDYMYDGDLLIPLQKGDWVVYYPSEKDRELEIAPKTELTMGVIFYCLGELDLSDYTVSYRFRMAFTEGLGFYALVLFALLTGLLVAGLYVAEVSYRNAMRENQIRQSGIASMSDVYAIIYFIDLEKDELEPVHADALSEERRPKALGAREQLIEMIRRDAEDSYRAVTEEFVDTATLEKRLERKSIAIEYISRERGWTRLQFFPMERKEGEPLRKAIFTMQDINAEKQELQTFEHRVAEAEMETRANSVFFAGIAKRAISWLGTIQELSGKILAESQEEKVQGWARQILSTGNTLTYTIDGGMDAARLATGSLTLNRKEYSLSGFVDDLCSMAESMLEGGSVAFERNIAEKLPDTLLGDAEKMKQVVVQLLSNAAQYTEKGSVKLSVFGKNEGERVHLLVSVKDTGNGIAERERKHLEGFIARLDEKGTRNTVGRGSGLEIAASLLAFMGSRLQVISLPGEGSEFYFEIEQEISAAGEQKA